MGELGVGVVTCSPRRPPPTAHIRVRGGLGVVVMVVTTRFKKYIRKYKGSSSNLFLDHKLLTCNNVKGRDRLVSVRLLKRVIEGEGEVVL